MSERRQAILDVALELFLDDDGTATIEEICRRSGASNGSVYHHFGSKDGIAGELTARFLSDYQEGFARALREHEGDARGGGRSRRPAGRPRAGRRASPRCRRPRSARAG